MDFAKWFLALLIATTLGISACGGGSVPTQASTDTQRENKDPNNSPVTLPLTLKGSPLNFIDEDSGFLFIPEIQGANGPVFFTVRGKPSWAEFDSDSGKLSGKPGNDDVGITRGIIISATDGISTASLPAFDLEVTNTNDPPLISGSPPISINEGDRYLYQIMAADPDARDTLTYELTAKPVGMQIDANGLLNWMPTSASVGTHEISVKVSDNGLPSYVHEQVFTLEVKKINHAPIILSQPINVATQGQNYIYQVIANDSDPADSLSYRLSKAPKGMSINSAGLIQWSPSSSDAEKVTVAVDVTDNGNPSYTSHQEYSISVAAPIPQANWSLLYVDSQDSTLGMAANAFDGDSATIWHTQVGSKALPPPHEIRINLGGAYDLNGFRYLPRQDYNQPYGRIAEYEFYTSIDGTEWGDPVAVGQFANDAAEKEVRFPIVTAFYVRLVAMHSAHANLNTTVAEINLLGRPFSGNWAPEIKIDTPSSNLSINVGDSVMFNATASDQDGNGPLTVEWDFGSSDVPKSVVEDPGNVKFTKPGTFVVSVKAFDVTGEVNSSPAIRIIKVQNGSTVIPSTRLSVHYVDSQENASESAGNAIDNDPLTSWSSRYDPIEAPLPHEIQINLGSAYVLDGLRYTPPQTLEGRIGQYRVFVSNDGKAWGSPVALGIFASEASEKRILFPPKLGQFVRFQALTDNDGGQRSAVAELNVEGACITPYVKLLSPITGSLFSNPTLQITSSVCLNPILHAGYGIKYVIDGYQSFIVNNPPYTATTPVLTRGEHIIEAFIVDAQGAETTGVTSYDKARLVGVGSYYVALGDSITYGVGDNDNTDNISQDSRNRDGGYTAVLNDLFTRATGQPHFIANEGVPGDKASDGLKRLPDIMKHHSQAEAYLIQFGTNDSSGSTPVPSGLGLSANAPGYAGSFKDNMQRIISLLKAQGKHAYLAKVPFYLNNSTRNNRIKAYNAVIDELIAENDIAIIPPDFFSYFAAHNEQLIDAAHPNGAGYKAMANLWYQALQ